STGSASTYRCRNRKPGRCVPRSRLSGFSLPGSFPISPTTMSCDCSTSTRSRSMWRRRRSPRTSARSSTGTSCRRWPGPRASREWERRITALPLRDRVLAALLSQSPPRVPISALLCSSQTPDLLLLQLPKWPGIVREISGVQHLDAGDVIAVEGRRAVSASCRGTIRRVTEPHTEMVGVDRRGHGIRHRIDARVRLRRRVDRLRDDKCLAAEDPHKLSTSTSVLVGVDITLIPGQAKGPRWDLQHEEREGCMRRQPLDLDAHPLVGSHGANGHMPLRLWQAPRGPRGDHHVKRELLGFSGFLVTAALSFLCHGGTPQPAEGEQPHGEKWHKPPPLVKLGVVGTWRRHRLYVQSH